MPYIGTQPTKVVSRQSANVYRYTATAGQSVFTGADLDNNVLACNPADLVVHMNGLRLESTDYTATSTTVTLTIAATAGDEVTITSFQTFEVADTYTKTTSDTRYVNTTGDTMTGVLALPTGGLTVGTDQLAVDSAGRVTMPYQPAFSVYPNASFTNSGGYNQITSLTGVRYNRGGHYSTSSHVFTAPVAGVYAFGYQLLLGSVDTSDDSIHVGWYKNGSLDAHTQARLDGNAANGYYGYGGYVPVIGHLNINLAANDTIGLKISNTGTITVHNSQSWGRLFGYLIG